MVGNKVYNINKSVDKFRFDSEFCSSSVGKIRNSGQMKIKLIEEGIVSTFCFGKYEPQQEGILKLVSRYNFPKKNLIIRWLLILLV